MSDFLHYSGFTTSAVKRPIRQVVSSLSDIGSHASENTNLVGVASLSDEHNRLFVVHDADDETLPRGVSDTCNYLRGFFAAIPVVLD